MVYPDYSISARIFQASLGVRPVRDRRILFSFRFEKGGEAWGGKNPVVDAPDGSGKALLFAGAGKGKYKSAWQSIELPVPGQSYLYTCWMWGDRQGGGSNLGESFSDGTKSKTYYMPAVFSMGAQGSSGA